MILDTQGGPNWVNNWCVAPIIVDPNIDEIYYTPLYYVMTHFSKYIRPGAEIIEAKNTCLLYTSPSPRDGLLSRMPSSA